MEWFSVPASYSVVCSSAVSSVVIISCILGWRSGGVELYVDLTVLSSVTVCCHRECV